MNLEEKRVDTDGGSRPRHMRHKLALAAGGRALSARNLHAVRGVHDDGIAELSHDRQRAHVGHKRVVAEAGAAFGQHDAAAAGFLGLGDDVLHIPGRKELSLFDVDGSAGLRGLVDEVRLAAEERRYLQNIEHLGRFFHLAAFMDVADGGHAEVLLNLGDDGKAFFQSGSAEGIVR